MFFYVKSNASVLINLHEILEEGLPTLFIQQQIIHEIVYVNFVMYFLYNLSVCLIYMTWEQPKIWGAFFCLQEILLLVQNNLKVRLSIVNRYIGFGIIRRCVMSKLTFICYSRCTTCKKAEKWLEDNGIKVEMRDIKEDNPSEKELRKWHKKSGLPLKRFFNTSGLKYKELGLKDKLSIMSDDEQYSLLATDGMLVKRPLLVSDSFVLVGFKETDWQELVKG